MKSYSLNVVIDNRYGQYLATTDSINFKHCAIKDCNPSMAFGSTPMLAIVNLIDKLNCRI